MKYPKPNEAFQDLPGWEPRVDAGKQALVLHPRDLWGNYLVSMMHLDLEADDHPLFEQAGWNAEVWRDTDVGFVVNPGECCCYPRIYSQGYLGGLNAEGEYEICL